MLPDTDGLQFLQQIRQTKSIPVLMLSALGHEKEKRIESFAQGADDFVSKPFEPLELFYRVNAILRRSKEDSYINHEIGFGDFMFDMKRKQLFFKEEPINLTQNEQKIILFLVKNFNQDVSRESFVNYVL